MKKCVVGSIALILLSVSLVGCGSSGSRSQVKEEKPPQQEQQQDNEAEKKAITHLVTDFGSSLQKVSLLAPEDLVKKSIQEYYGKYVSEALLTAWIYNPEKAPGRLVSSPWPDRIEISDIIEIEDTEYQVYGEIIEITNDGATAATRPITIVVKKMDSKWMIDKVTMGDYEEETTAVEYQNAEYGFHFFLPTSWENYTIVTENWEGQTIDDPQTVNETGPTILIRHPEWTSENPRQDIPIMVFTYSQWNALQKEEFHIGAAPIGPRELGRNNQYVFALPARYNFAFPEGYEEVERIFEGNPLLTIDVNQ